MPRKIVPPFYLIITIALMVTLHKLLPLATVVPPPWSYAGAVVMLTGLGILMWSARLFARAETPIKPFEESTRLITGGMYRLTRNPMYLGMVFMLLGIALLLGTLSPFLPIPLFVWLIHSVFILNEEVMMEDLFGEEYREFRQRVRRWI